jgi:hypothetical protein
MQTQEAAVGYVVAVDVGLQPGVARSQAGIQINLMFCYAKDNNTQRWGCRAAAGERR